MSQVNSARLPLAAVCEPAAGPVCAPPNVACDSKQFETLRARSALAGFSLVQLPDGTFMASRWGMHRDLAHPADVERFLARVIPGGAGG